MLSLQSVGRSNFDKGRHNLTTLIQKSTYTNESCYIIYTYIYSISEKHTTFDSEKSKLLAGNICVYFE